MCDCLRMVNESLRKQFGCEVVRTIPTDKKHEPRAIVATERIDAKREKPATLMAVFCPFCGAEYDPLESMKLQEPAKNRIVKAAKNLT